MDNSVEKFLEKHNMEYMFLVLANLEIERLNSLPDFVKKKFDQKITEVALSHVAKNDIPDYVIEQPEEPVRRLDFDDDDEEDDE